MATFKTLIEARIGSFSNTDLIDHTLTEGARIIVDRLDGKLDLYATEKIDGGTGIDITGGKVIKAHKSGYNAMRVDSANKARYSLVGSIYKATATDPIWYSEKQKGYVIPSGGTLLWVAYPTVLNTESAIANFPPQTYPVIVLYSSVNCQLSIVSTLIATTMAGLSFTNPTNVTPPSAPSFTYTDASGNVISATTISVSKTLTFNPPVFSGSYTNIDSALSDKDVDLATGEANKLNLQINQYQADWQTAKTDFDKEAKQYDTDLQKAISQAGIDAQKASEQARLTNDTDLQNALRNYQKEVEEYQAKLSKYQTDIRDFAAQVDESAQKVLTETQKNSGMLQGYFALADKLKQEYVEALGAL